MATLLSLLFSGCINHGNYRYGGAFPNAQLPAVGKQIGILDPRGPFGDVYAQKTVQNMLKSVFRQCNDATIYTEDQLNAQDKLPAIYNEHLSDSNLEWFVKNTTLDYLILLDVGPGILNDQPDPLLMPSADREASVSLLVYDLADGGILKEVTVTGQLKIEEDLQFWELSASEESMGLKALRKAMKRLGKFTDCR